MRIIGEISHPTLKITLMHHGRYLLKLEDRDVELVYRFRDEEGVANLADARKLLDLGLLQSTERQLHELSAERKRLVQALHQAPGEDEFPIII